MRARRRAQRSVEATHGVTQLVSIGWRIIGGGEATERHCEVVFHGKDRTDVKRRAVAWWSEHGKASGLSLRDFLSCCRLAVGERTIVYIPRTVRS